MYSIEKLLEIAMQADETYKERSKQFGPGTYDVIRNEAYKLRENAIFAAAHLEKQGITGEVTAVGSFCMIKAGRGQKVRLKAGAIVRSRGEAKENARNRTITVFDMYEGFINPNAHHRDPSIRNPEVVWAGAGGYWCRTDANNVELI